MAKGLRVSTFSVLAMCMALGCVVHTQTGVRSGGDESGEDESGAAAGQGAAIEGSTVVEEPASGPPRTVEELRALRSAIVETLRASTEPWAADIADRTENADCELDADGTARIGGWMTAPCGEDCEERQSLRYIWREEGRQVPSYLVEVERRGGGFECTNLGQFLVVQ